MNVQVVGCSYHGTSVGVRERLAFNAEQARTALGEFCRCFVRTEAVLLSTCNRVEWYTATEDGDGPTPREVTEFLARFHGMQADEIVAHLYDRSGEAAIRHLFAVASSLDSMVVGEPQILAQVKQAYQLADAQRSVGPLLHAAFQAARKTARRVAAETAIQQRRVSIPSVAVADFAQQIFERFDDKNTLVVGAGEMAEETLRYLQDQGAADVTVINRSPERAAELAGRWGGRALAWEALPAAIQAADLVISATGAGSRSSRCSISSTSNRDGRVERCSSSTWPCRAISIRRSASGPRSISTPSTTCGKRAKRTAASGTRKCPPPCALSRPRRTASWAI